MPPQAVEPEPRAEKADGRTVTPDDEPEIEEQKAMMVVMWRFMVSFGVVCFMPGGSRGLPTCHNASATRVRTQAHDVRDSLSFALTEGRKPRPHAASALMRWLSAP
jgi:hypothetical protein